LGFAAPAGGGSVANGPRPGLARIAHRWPTRSLGGAGRWSFIQSAAIGIIPRWSRCFWIFSTTAM
jgi:hypothetical protein